MNRNLHLEWYTRVSSARELDLKNKKVAVKIIFIHETTAEKGNLISRDSLYRIDTVCVVDCGRFIDPVQR